MTRYLGLLGASAVVLAGCSIWTGAVGSPSKTGVSVNVHGVNYTAEPFRYAIVDPGDPSNKAGGEHIGPFSGGGILCCFMLPKQWSPGLKVEIRSTHWLPKAADGNLPEIKNVFTIDIPPYPNGKAGELWVLRTADGGIDVVSSNLQPDHPQWPGKVKGWPQPSLSYQRQSWELHKKEAEDSRENFRSLLKGLETTPQKVTQEAWDVAVQLFSEEIKRFRGPGDPAYAEYLKSRYMEGWKRAEQNLED